MGQSKVSNFTQDALTLSLVVNTYRARSATIGGTIYKRKNVVVYNMAGEEPSFGETMDIIRTNTEETIFILNKLCIVRFHMHYHSYQVTKTSCKLILTQKEFKDHHPLHACRSHGRDNFLFVSMRYHICSI